jgi:hypothetical protein
MNRSVLLFPLRILVTGLAVLSLAPALGLAADYEQKEGQATLRIRADRVENNELEIRLSGELALTLSVTGPASLEVRPLRVLSPSGDWEPGPTTPPERLTLSDRERRWQQRFTLKPVKAGELVLPLAPLAYRDGPEASWHNLTWKPVRVRVTTEIANADLSELRDITPPEQLADSPSWHGPYVGLGLVLAVLFVVLAVREYRRRRRQPPPALLPDAWVLGELDRIAALPLTSEEATEHFHAELSDVMRRYLEMRFQIPALEQTTAEFFAGLERSVQLTKEQHGSLHQLMKRWDLVKFARLRPPPEECQALIHLARQFVEQTKLDAERQPVVSRRD